MSKLSQKDAERFWAQDRANLALCRDKLTVIVYHYDNLTGKFKAGERILHEHKGF